ncbi:glucosaminidase domain-containing protein [Dickeya fangzhongdai]|uniref:glycoside hydrolase family 73 protein n=1 Tax=Dickeya fangzhongdai TaxID=1778540 RepID=UPI002B2F0720|nr:glucosaminidase domain-containing protein [Dickeya fangzhongdai]
MKKNNTTRKQLFVVIKKTRSFAKKTEITTHSRQNTATTSGTASSYSNTPSAGLDSIRLPAPEAGLPGAPVPAASQPTPPAAPPVATVPPLPKFNKPHAETAAAPSAPAAQPSTSSAAPQPSLPSPAPIAAASTAEPEAAQEPTTPPFAPDYAAVGNQLSKLMSGMAAPLSRLAGNLHGFTAQSLLKPAQSVTPKESKAIVPASNPTESISLPTAPAQKASTPISSGKTGTVQRALATGAAYKQGNIEGLDDAHTRALVASTAATESAGGKLDIRNSAGYIGRYQAGASWLAEAGLIAGGANAVIAAMKADGFTNEYKWGKSGGMTRFLKNKNNWKNGLDYEKYLSSAEAQDTAFKTNSDKAYKQLVKEGTITSKMSQDEIAGILKARHIGGLGGARKAAKGIEGAMDANGTSALKYKNDLAAGNVFIESYQSGIITSNEKVNTKKNKNISNSNPSLKRSESKKIETKNTLSKIKKTTEGKKPTKPDLSKENNDFVKKIYKEALTLETETGVPAAITAAQAILESGYGKRMPVDINTKEISNNLFGIKANDKYIKNGGKYVNIITTEYVPIKGQEEKQKIKVIGKFRAYQSSEDSLRDHASFLKGNKRYKDLFSSKNPMKWAEGLQAAGYATDPEYANKLKGVIMKFGLDQSTKSN